MPLQIRRGTNAERGLMTQPLARGELLFVEDTERLYIGNGSTLGGVQITGYTNEDAVDAAGGALVAGNGTNGNITFTYGSTQDSANRINAAINLSNYVGNIGATSVTANILATDSTVMINAATGSINLSGTVKGHIIPNTDVAYDLGSSSFRFRDLYLSGSSIKLGSATITATGTTVNLPAGSTINGEPLGAFSVGQNINVNIVGDDSTILVNTSTNTILGTHIGVQRGNVQAADSSVMFDATTKVISAQSITLGGSIGINGTSITNSNVDNVIRFDGASIDVFSNFGVTQPGISTTGITNGSATTSIVSFYGSRGTVLIPTTLTNGDNFSGMIFLGHNGVDHVPGTAMFAAVDGVPNSANPSIPGKFVISVADGTNDIFAANKQMVFGSNGVLTAPIIKPGSYPTGSLPTSPAEGWIVFDSTTKEWKGWNGITWQILG